jgi:hypothetical protein
LVVAPPAPIEADAGRAQGNFGFFMQADGRRRIERNAIPYQLGTRFDHALGTRECPSGIRRLDFKSQWTAERLDQTKIVQQRGDCEHLRIVWRLSLLGNGHGEQPRSHDVIQKIWLTMRARVFDGASDQRRIGYRDASD